MSNFIRPEHFDFAVIATLEYGESPEKSRARVALASTHTPDIQQRTLDTFGRIFVQYINKETKAENKLQKTLSLLNILSEYIFIHLPKNLSKKELQKHIFSQFIQTEQTTYQQAKDKQNPESMSKSYILGVVAWYTLHRLNYNIVETEESAMQQLSRVMDSAKNLFSSPEKRYQHKIHLVQEAGAIDFDPIFTDPTFTNYIISKKILQLSPSHITRPRYTLSALMKAETAWTSKRFEDLRHAKAQYEARSSAQRDPLPLAAPDKTRG
ncbi:hypothetical protein AVM71_04820 [Piscirickettsia salmonis]|nr:hypothetical protein AVM71_04820 [Piscirickettsia salmonis]